VLDFEILFLNLLNFNEMKKLVFGLIFTLGLIASSNLNASCTCDASTRFRCSGEDSQGNKCKGTGAIKVEFADADFGN
jgi:hypothetical protein